MHAMENIDEKAGDKDQTDDVDQCFAASFSIVILKEKEEWN